MVDVPVVDTHVHLWDVDRDCSPPWLVDYPLLNRSFLLEDYNAATEGIEVDTLVFVECEVGPGRCIEEAKWVASLSQEDPRIKGVIPWAPLENGEGARSVLEELKGIRQVKGIRRLIQFEKDPEFCVRSDFIKGLQLLPEYDLRFDICISHHQLPNTIEMVRQCPETVFILDHMAKPDIKNSVLEPWSRSIRILSESDHVFCKVSGLITEGDEENWKREDIKPYIDHVINCFGFDRLLFGGDWPVVNMAGAYPQWFEALEWALSGCSKSELQKLFCDNAKKAYGLADN